MFKLVLAATFMATVSISLMTETGSKVSHEFKARFKYLGQKEFEALVKSLGAEGVTDEMTLEKVWAGWDETARDEQGRPLGVCDEHGQPLANTPENRAMVADVLGMRAALVGAFFNAHQAAPAKNSGPVLAGSTSGEQEQAKPS